MFDVSDPDIRDSLATRLAHKARLSEEQARSFLNALKDVTAERDQEYIVFGHMISIPLVEQEDGKIVVDTSGYSAWWPFTKPKDPPQQPPPSPPGGPAKPRRPSPPAPGAYPGPSVVIKVDDWLGVDLRLGTDALGRLRQEVLAKSERPRFSKDLISDYSLSQEKLEEK